MASSVSQVHPETGVVAEFERLAGRTMNRVESEVVRLATEGGSVWVENLRQDALVLLALSLASTEQQRILVLSPDADSISQRQHRWGTRAPLHSLADRGTKRSPTGPCTLLASLDSLVDGTLARSLRGLSIDRVFVEQAHAATSHSFEFRPGFAFFSELLEQIGQPPVVCGAALSPESVRTEAQQVLGLLGSSAPVYLSDAPRQTSIQVLSEQQAQSLLDLVTALPRPALLLCSSPAQADAVYAQLMQGQLPCHRYHAGLPARERATELLQFALPGRRAILVATSSFGPAGGFAGETDTRLAEDFGRGYTRADLRTLVHLGAPASPEQYAQELSLLQQETEEKELNYALFLFQQEQLLTIQSLLERKRPCPETLAAVVTCLKKQARGVYLSESELIQSLGSTPRPVQLVLSFLKDARALECASPSGEPSYRARSLSTLESIAEQLKYHFLNLQTGDKQRISQIAEYAASAPLAQTTGDALCRWQILQALAQPSSETTACGYCDHCNPNYRPGGGTWLSGVSPDAPVERIRKKRARPLADPEDNEDWLSASEDHIASA